MRTVIWRDLSFTCGSFVLILCLFQVPGWLQIPPQLGAPFILSAMCAQGAAFAVGLFLERSRLPIATQGVIEAALTSALCIWWAPIEPTTSVCIYLILASAGAFLSAVGMIKLSSVALADSINEDIARTRACKADSGSETNDRKDPRNGRNRRD